MFEVPESYLREEAGVAYKGYYGDIGRKGFENSLGGMNGFSVDFFK